MTYRTVYPRIMAHLRIVAQSEGTVDIQIVAQSRIIAHSRIITAINNFKILFLKLLLFSMLIIYLINKYSIVLKLILIKNI